MHGETVNFRYMYNIHVLGYIISPARRTYPLRVGDIFVLSSTESSDFLYAITTNSKCTIHMRGCDCQYALHSIGPAKTDGLFTSCWSAAASLLTENAGTGR
jgi:hypothetical protein